MNTMHLLPTIASRFVTPKRDLSAALSAVGLSTERLDRIEALKRSLAARCAAEPSPRNLDRLAALTNPILGRARAA